MSENLQTRNYDNGRFYAPYFWWQTEWVKYMHTIQSAPERLNFALSIAEYGLYGNEPYRLCCDELEYFNNVVRPNLDKQRKRMRAKQWKKK